MNSHWIYKDANCEELPEDVFGFVYMIINNLTGRKYIGRKYGGKIRRKPLTKKQKKAGRTRRTVIRSESNWRVYTGSNKQLNLDIDEFGKDNFTFKILIFATTKGQVNYLEENLHHKFNVITDPLFYNDAVGPKRFANMKHSKEFHKKVVELLD